MPERYSTRDIRKILLALGFTRVSQRGSHVKFSNSVDTVIVPAGRNVIRAGAFASILRQSGLTAADFDDTQA
jgi:predicted RNA binding protein YcfA (HicA-like mRNA interferase family)